jgi:hypothetical protein
VTFDPNVANCAIDELGIVYATSRIRRGVKLSMLSRHDEED